MSNSHKTTGYDPTAEIIAAIGGMQTLAAAAAAAAVGFYFGSHTDRD